MATTNINMRLDVTTKDQLNEVLGEYGLTIPQAFKLLANQIIRTRSVPLSFEATNTEIAYEQNPLTMQAIQDAREGRVSSYH